MPRCFMAKKLKYPYEQWKDAQRASPSPAQPMGSDNEEEDEEIDLVGLPADEQTPKPDGQAPINLADYKPAYEGLFSGAFHHVPTTAAHQLLAAHLSRQYGLPLPPGFPLAAAVAPEDPAPAHQRRGSLTPPPDSSSAASPKKDIFRPYCLSDPVMVKAEPRPDLASAAAAAAASLYPYSSPAYLQYRNIEDINTAHAILDLSRSSTIKSESHPIQPEQDSPADLSARPSQAEAEAELPSPLLSPASTSASDEHMVFSMNGGKTTAYTYEAFFASDGRSRKKNGLPIPAPVQTQSKPRYTCTECGKHYATSSNLSRHKQTHRSLDSANAKKCHVCGKCYVSMPALSMHILTHNLNHKCDVCGKAFSRPWLLQGHMRSHSGDKPYGCAHCGKSFADRSNLRAHMQTHSAFKNFKCKRCHKSFALKSYLNKHYESACFKDQPIPSIPDSPPSTPAPSDMGSDGGLASPGSISGSSSISSHPSPNGSTTSEHHFGSLLSLLPQQPNPILGV